MRVDFPDPEGPIRATNSFLSIVKEIERSARTVSVPTTKCRAISFNLIISWLIGLCVYANVIKLGVGQRALDFRYFLALLVEFQVSSKFRVQSSKFPHLKFKYEVLLCDIIFK